jgi:SAM-dependent methyltransferase
MNRSPAQAQQDRYAPYHPEGTGAGLHALEALSTADNLGAWVVSRFSQHLRGDILEIGSGIGSIGRLLLPWARSLMLTDLEPSLVAGLKVQFAAEPRVSATVYDLEGAPPPEVASRRFDTIVAVNVLEHIEDDAAALEHLRARLKTDGRVCIYVPAGPFAFGSLDLAVGHHRRYTAQSLDALLTRAGLERLRPPRYMNVLGLLGWFVNGRVLRRRNLPVGQLALFNRLVPLLRLEDRLVAPVGLGLTVVARARP